MLMWVNLFVIAQRAEAISPKASTNGVGVRNYSMLLNSLRDVVARPSLKRGTV